MTSKIVLLLCGSFNPITYMHLRMFEVARDFFRESNYGEVIGGIISPVNKAYSKAGLLSASHRCDMVNLAIDDNPFLICDDWEAKQDSWCRTKMVLENTQKRLKNELYDSHATMATNTKSRRLNNGTMKTQKWIEVIDFKDDIKVKLLCGGDLLESFAIPDLWSDEDMKYIVKEHGLVVISRDSSNPTAFIYENDMLHEYKQNVYLLQNWMGSDISSTKIRRAIKRHQSVKYLIPDSVIEYIKERKLYIESKDASYV